MSSEQSLFEWRRLATAWWYGKADNARFAALALAQLTDDAALKVAEVVNYHGTTSVALNEAFLREASIALELIVKAVIAQTLELRNADPAIVGVPPTHDLPALWLEAGLTSVSLEDQYRLFRFKTILIWAGKYPTPKSERVWEKEMDVFRRLEEPLKSDGKLFLNPISCSAEDFDRLYKIAETRLHELMQRCKSRLGGLG